MERPNSLIRRTAARLVVVGEGARILLFRHTDGCGGEFWATPGGGLEPGEQPEAAARREAAEELGAEQVELTLLWSGRTEFVYAHSQVEQTETFFLVTGPTNLDAAEVRARHRLEGIAEVRWWSVVDIAAATERLYPIDLADRVAGCLRWKGLPCPDDLKRCR